MSTKIFVGGLSRSINDTDLRARFEEFGRIETATVIMDRDSGHSRGFGFVTYEDLASVDEAIQRMHNREMEGRTISVKVANKETDPAMRREARGDREDFPPRNGGGGGPIRRREGGGGGPRGYSGGGSYGWEGGSGRGGGGGGRGGGYDGYPPRGGSRGYDDGGRGEDRGDRSDRDRGPRREPRGAPYGRPSGGMGGGGDRGGRDFGGRRER